MTMSELTSAFEAVLFSGGEPQSIDRFSQVFDITPEKVVKVMEALEKGSMSKKAAWSFCGLITHISWQRRRNMPII